MTLEEQIKALTARVEELEAQSAKKRSRNFQPPTLQDVEQYAASRGEIIDGNEFIDFYESKGWKVGSAKMKCWKSSARRWVRNQSNFTKPNAVTLANKNSKLVTDDTMGWLE
jgi:hypothetical protein